MSDIQTLENEYEAAKSDMTGKRALVTRAERRIKKGEKVNNIGQLKKDYESAKSNMTIKRALLTRAKRSKKKKTSPRVSPKVAPKTVVSPRNISNRGFDSLSSSEKKIFINHMENKEAVLSPEDNKYRYGGREVYPYVYQSDDLFYGLEVLKGDMGKKIK